MLPAPPPAPCGISAAIPAGSVGDVPFGRFIPMPGTESDYERILRRDAATEGGLFPNAEMPDMVKALQVAEQRAMQNGTGGILRDSIRVFRNWFAGFFAIGAVVGVCEVLVRFGMNAVTDRLVTNTTPALAATLYSLLTEVVNDALFGIVGTVGYVTVFRFVEQLERREDPSFRGAIARALPRIGTVALLAMIVGAIYGSFDFLQDAARSESISFLLLIAAVAALVYLAPALSQAPFICVSSQTGLRQSIRHGMRMVTGHRGTIIGQLFLLSLPLLGVTFVVTLVLSRFGPAPPFVTGVLSTLSRGLTYPIMAIGLSSIHLGLRATYAAAPPEETSDATGARSARERTDRLTIETMRSVQTRSAARLFSWIILLSATLIAAGFWIATNAGATGADLQDVAANYGLIASICVLTLVLSRRGQHDRGVLHRYEKLKELHEERKRRFLRRAAGRVAEDHNIGEDVQLTGSVFTLTDRRGRAAKISDGRRRWIVTWRDGRWEYL